MTDMLTEGAGAMDANAFKERLEELNMSLGFGAGWDGVGMSLTTLSENRDAAFEMARLALHEPRFDAEPLARIKRQMLVGIRTRETNPSYISDLALDQALYPDHPYARRTSRESVEAITRAAYARAPRGAVQPRDAADHHRRRYRRGDAGPRARLTSSARCRRAPRRRSRRMSRSRAPTPLIVRQLPQPQSLVLFAAPGIQDEDPDWIPLAVANYILGGGGFSSRLMDQVREQRGLVYGIGTGPSVRDHVALIRGSAQTENGDVREAIEVTRAEMGRLYRDGATQAEVNDAITYLTGSFALDLDCNVEDRSASSTGYQAAGRDIDYINRRNDLIRARDAGRRQPRHPAAVRSGRRSRSWSWASLPTWTRQRRRRTRQPSLASFRPQHAKRAESRNPEIVEVCACPGFRVCDALHASPPGMRESGCQPWLRSKLSTCRTAIDAKRERYSAGFMPVARRNSVRKNDTSS